MYGGSISLMYDQTTICSLQELVTLMCRRGHNGTRCQANGDAYLTRCGLADWRILPRSEPVGEPAGEPAELLLALLLR